MLSLCCRCCCLLAAIVPGVLSWSAAAPTLHDSQTARLRPCQSQQSQWQQGRHWTRRRASHARTSSRSSCRAAAGSAESDKLPPKSYYVPIDEADIDDESTDVLPRYLEDLDDDIWDEYNEGEEPEGDSEYMDIPNGSLLGDLAFNPREEGGLGDETLENIAADYNFPIEFIYDVLCQWGVNPPIKPDDKLGCLVNGEQAFAVVEALTSVDSAILHDWYMGETLEGLADELEVPLSEVFAIAGRNRFSLPMGAETHISNADYRVLLRELGMDDAAAAIEEDLRRGQGKVKRNNGDRMAMNTNGMLRSDMFNTDDIDGMFASDDAAPTAKPFLF